MYANDPRFVCMLGRSAATQALTEVPLPTEGANSGDATEKRPRRLAAATALSGGIGLAARARGSLTDSGAVGALAARGRPGA